MRMLEFQEILNRRNSLLTQLDGKQCIACPDFDEHVSGDCISDDRIESQWLCILQYSIIHAEKVLRANIEMLKLAISDQNLELIPDYEQRIDVLKELKFIDENSTVLLKGRVACEVRIRLGFLLAAFFFGGWWSRL